MNLSSHAMNTNFHWSNDSNTSKLPHYTQLRIEVCPSAPSSLFFNILLWSALPTGDM